MCNFVVPLSKSGGAVFPASSLTYGCKTNKENKINKQANKKQLYLRHIIYIYKHQTNYFVSDDQ